MCISCLWKRREARKGITTGNGLLENTGSKLSLTSASYLNIGAAHIDPFVPII